LPFDLPIQPPFYHFSLPLNWTLLRSCKSPIIAGIITSPVLNAPR